MKERILSVEIHKSPRYSYLIKEDDQVLKGGRGKFSLIWNILFNKFPESTARKNIIPEKESYTTFLKNGEFFEGRVKWFNDDKGFGFIDRIEDLPEGESAFLHYSQIDELTIKDNDKVRFHLQDSSRGLRAVNVSRVVNSF